MTHFRHHEPLTLTSFNLAAPPNSSNRSWTLFAEPSEQESATSLSSKLPFKAMNVFPAVQPDHQVETPLRLAPLGQKARAMRGSKVLGEACWARRAAGQLHQSPCWARRAAKWPIKLANHAPILQILENSQTNFRQASIRLNARLPCWTVAPVPASEPLSLVPERGEG